MNLDISFQGYDKAFGELVDLEDGEELEDLEKLTVIVTPILVTPPAVRSSVYVHTCDSLMCSWWLSFCRA